MTPATTQLLAGDIGGTKTILRWLETGGETPARLTVRHEAEYPSGKYDDLVPLVRTFLAEAEAAQQGDDLEPPAPRRACFAIAGPVVNGQSDLTNLGWQLSEARLKQALGLERVALINDFAAVGYGILGLEPTELHSLQNPPGDPLAPVAVIGAGTGLGQCFVIPTAGGRPRVFATEGGHSDFAPRTALEFRLLEYLQETRSLGHVSVERIVSGQGIVAFYQFCAIANRCQKTRKSPRSSATGSRPRPIAISRRIPVGRSPRGPAAMTCAIGP